MTFSKLGTDLQTGHVVELPKTSRLQGLYIIGIQGTGKSGLIENLIMQDIKQQIGVCVLDPHGELIEHVIARLPGRAEEEKVILLDVSDEDYPFGLNLFTCSNPNSPKEVEKTVDKVMHVFDKLLGVDEHTPLISQYLLHCTHTLVANPGYTMAEIPLLLTDKNCRQHLVANVKKKQTRLFWDEYYDPMPPQEQRRERIFIQRRVEKFLQDITLPIVGQSTTTIDVQKIMDEGKILLVKLDPEMEQVTALVGSLFVALLLNAAYARPTNKRRQIHLYADEFERFATEDFATLLEQARKFGIATTIAHQNRGQLNSANSKLETDLKDRSRSVGNMVVFRVNSKDAEDLAGEFKIAPQPARLEVLKEEWHDRIEEYVEDGKEIIRTPVMEPIQYMVSHGIHPLEHTRTFIETYGKDLVELAKKEEDDERARLNEERRFQHDLIAGVRYLAPPQIPVTYHYRNLLKMFNKLFYDAMMAGKTPENLEKNLDDMLERILIVLVDNFIQAFQWDKHGYREALAAYQVLISERSGAVETVGVIDALISASKGEVVNTYNFATLQQHRDYDQCLKDGIIDALAEDIAKANRRWWQIVEDRGVEQSLTGNDFSPSLVPNSKKPAIFIPLFEDNPNLAARRFELYNQLSELPAALLQKERFLQKGEAKAKQRLHEAYRIYLVAQVRAARASMLFIERYWKYIVGTRTEDGTARIYFPELFSHDELYSLIIGAQHYNRDALIIFENEEGTDHSVQPTTYDDLRKSWVGVGQAFFFNTWEEAVSHYFQLFSDCWFRINPQTFVDKRNWQKTVREVYWRRRYTGSRWVYETNYRKFPGKKQWMHETNVVKEDKKRLWLQTWELKPGIEHTWFTPALIEAEIDRGIRAIEAYPTGGDNHPFYGGYGFLEKLLFIETSEFDPAYGHFRSVIMDNAQQVAYAWEEARKRTQMLPEKAALAVLQKQIEQELALLKRIEAEKKIYDVFVAEFREQIRQVMGELAIAPVEQESGLQQPGKRKQIHYLPHARETLTHPQRPFKDVKDEIASQLVNLPNFTARVKIAAANGTVEHTIKTLEPEKGLYGKALQERIARIQAQNRRDGYTRARADVEAEITQRQSSGSGFPVAQPQVPPPQPRHARTVPVQGNCPNCGATNQSGVRFCNQCGTKLR